MPTYNKKTRLETHGGHAVPSLRRVAARPDLGVAINTAADTTLLTLPAIEACGNPVVIEACIALAVGANSVATFKLFRSDDGGGSFAEINVANRYVETALLANGQKVVALTWYDQPLTTTELAMAPIYRLVAIATLAGLTAAVPTHLIAHI